MLSKKRLGRLPALVLVMFLLAVAAAGCGCRTANLAPVQPTKQAATTETTFGGNTNSANGTGEDGPITPNTVAQGREEAGQREAHGASTGKEASSELTGSGTTDVKQVREPDTRKAGVNIQLIVTKDFGKTEILTTSAEVQSEMSVLDLLRSCCEIKTAYGGGLVTSINNIESGSSLGRREDWFFFVNGICSDVGARDYKLNSGDVVWWDFHPWGMSGLINSAVIGTYPEPFLHGYRGVKKPTIILYTEGSLGAAMQVKKAFADRGIKPIKLEFLSEELLAVREGPTVIIGEWDELKKVPYIENLNKGYRRNGTYAHFIDEGIELMDFEGNPSMLVREGAGIIAATGNGLGDQSPLWLLVGTDREGLEGVAKVLCERPEQIYRHYSAAVLEDKVIRLPLWGK